MSDPHEFPFPTMLPPTLQRISLDFESISKAPTPGVDTGIELQFDQDIVPNKKLNDTFSTCSSGNNNEDEDELTVSVISDHESHRLRKMELKDDYEGEEGMIRKRKGIFLIVALLPFLAASMSLFAAMASRSSSSSSSSSSFADDMDNNPYATKDLESALVLRTTDAPSFAPMGVSTDDETSTEEEEEEDDDPQPSDQQQRPSSRPTIETVGKLQAMQISEETNSQQQQQQQQQHGGLRSSSSPTAQRSFFAEPTITASPTTNAPSSDPPTVAPTGYCVAAGVPCPNRNVALCCSDICERSSETGEMVCAPSPSEEEEEGFHAAIDDEDFGNFNNNFNNNNNNNNNNYARPPEEGNNRPQTDGYCVAAGIPCPNRNIALCCSDICIKDRDTGEQLCAPIPEEEDTTPANIITSPKEEEELPLPTVVADEEKNAAYCVQEGNPCPDRKVALCCSDICEKNKETKQYECAAVASSSQKDKDKNKDKDKDKDKQKDR